MDAQGSALLEHASALRRAGRVEDAIAAYEALLEREPDLPDSWYNLGWLQKQTRRYPDAIRSYGEALKRGVREPEEVHLNRAVIFSDHLARPDEAEAELNAALRLNSGYLPALLNLGNLKEDLGDRAAAEEAYRRALAVAPGNALALSRLAGVIAAGSEASGAFAGELRDALSRNPASDERADLGFALGRLLDGEGKYGEAFAAYEAANRASRESFGPAFRGYDRAAHERFVDRLIDSFRERTAPSNRVSPAIFIAGLFRSGSTLVEQILAGHSRIASGGELDLIPALLSTVESYPEAVTSADQGTIDSWRDFYLEGLRPFTRKGALVTDKRPDNFLHIGFIKTLFPNAKIVHTRRNRLDNLLSLYFLHLGSGMPYALDLADAAHWHGEYERLMAHWKRLYPDDIFEVDYDTLVRDPEPRVRELLSFLRLDWEDSVLEFNSRRGAVKTASVWQVREPLHARSSGRWRNYESQLKAAFGPLGAGG